MNDEIKTFVYVSRETVNCVGAKLNALKAGIFKVLTVCVIMIAVITSILVIRMDIKSTENVHSTDADISQANDILPCEVRSDASRISPDMDKSLFSYHITSESDIISTYDNTEIIESEDETIVLLSLDEMAGFSPLGGDMSEEESIVLSQKAEDVAEMLENGMESREFASRLEEVESSAEAETSSYEYSSRLDEVDKKIEDATKPKDVPHTLQYSYNKHMVINPDAEEITVLQRIVEAEAGDQDIYGRILVADVILNRVRNKQYPGTISGVVFQKIGNSVQFSPVVDGSFYSVAISEKTREAVERALAGEDYSEGALYFFMRSGTSAEKASWFDRDLKYLFKYGCHEFFKDKK